MLCELQLWVAESCLTPWCPHSSALSGLCVSSSEAEAVLTAALEFTSGPVYEPPQTICLVSERHTLYLTKNGIPELEAPPDSPHLDPDDVGFFPEVKSSLGGWLPALRIYFFLEASSGFEGHSQRRQVMWKVATLLSHALNLPKCPGWKGNNTHLCKSRSVIQKVISVSLQPLLLHVGKFLQCSAAEPKWREVLGQSF